MAELRPGLRNVVGPAEHVPAGLPGRRKDGRRSQAAAAFDRMCPARLADLADQDIERGLEARRHLIEVIPLDTVVARVVLGGHEPTVVAYVQPLPQQAGPHLRPVGKRRKDPRIRPAMLARTGTTIVGRQVWIVPAIRTVPEDQDQRCEVVRQANHAQEGGDLRNLFGLAPA